MRVAIYKCLEKNTLKVVEVTTPVNRPPSPRKYIEVIFKEWAEDENSKKTLPDTGEKCR